MLTPSSSESLLGLQLLRRQLTRHNRCGSLSDGGNTVRDRVDNEVWSCFWPALPFLVPVVLAVDLGGDFFGFLADDFFPRPIWMTVFLDLDLDCGSSSEDASESSLCLLRECKSKRDECCVSSLRRC